MNREDVIRLARKAGLIGPEDTAHDILECGLELWVSGEHGMQMLECFALEVINENQVHRLNTLHELLSNAQAAEREACEKACWDAETNDWEGRKACIDAIRARKDNT